MRARARAVAAAAGAAIVVVPLTGAAAVALVATEPGAPATHVVAESSLSFADAVAPIEAAQVPAVVAAGEDIELTLDTPEVKVKANPEPVVRSSSRTVSHSRPVVSSASVKAAVSSSAVVAEAMKYLGVPYVHGGSSPSGFDCSGLVSYVYGQLGIDLPHSSRAYKNVGTRVSSPQPGDIIVSPGHVGIYVSKNRQIDAPTTGKDVQLRSIWQDNPIYVRVT